MSILSVIWSTASFKFLGTFSDKQVNFLFPYSEYGSNGSGDNEKYAGSTIVHLSKNKPSIGKSKYDDTL